jgi:uncharacterized protein
LLLNAGADVQGSSSKYSTPLHYAALSHSTDVLKLFLEKGASVTAVDLDKRTPLHDAKHAVDIDLLVKYGADINARDDRGNSTLQRNVTDMTRGNDPEWYIETITALIEAGSSLTAKNKKGQTAYDIAVKRQLGDDILTLLQPDTPVPPSSTPKVCIHAITLSV